MSTYDKSRDLVDIGAYKFGANLAIDEALNKYPDIEKFLMQTVGQHTNKSDAMESLRSIIMNS